MSAPEREPPHNLEAEQAALGAVLLGGTDTLAEVAELLAWEDFYSKAHQAVYRAASDLDQRGEPVDDVTILVELQRQGVLQDIGGAPLLVTLAQGVPTVGMAGHYARIVADLARRRRYIDAGARIGRLAFEDHLSAEAIAELARSTLEEANRQAGPSTLFKRWTMRELLEADEPFTWRIRGMLVHPTYGPIGGEQKTLKSYVSGFITVGLAAGVPVFDHFKVDEPATVVAYVGEGGRIPYTRRLKRIADAMGVDLAGIPLLPSFDVAPIGSTRFNASLARDLRDEPGLVVIDPLYAYHPPSTSASNLYERGSMLAGLSGACMDAGASLLIPDHWNKTGTGRGLDRISQAGMQQWADSWLLLSHREDPDVENGYFQLLLEIGSRQWGGASWNLDLRIGRFDPDLGEHVGSISWELARASTGDGKDTGSEKAILTLLKDRPFELTQSAVVSEVGGNRERTRKTLERLMDQRRVVAAKVPRMEGGRPVSRERLAITEEPVPPGTEQVGTGSPS